jgi:prophage regulatory protein
MEQQIQQSLLRLKQVQARTGLSKTGLYARIAAGTFPPSVKLGQGARSAAWASGEVDAWIQARIAERKPRNMHGAQP